MEEKFFKFTYRSGQPVSNRGKVVLLDKHRHWELAEGFEYIIDTPVILELEKCIIIKSAKKFVLVEGIKPIYEVCGSHIKIKENIQESEINFNVKKKVIYIDEIISSETDYENFKFGITGNEEFYNLLPTEVQNQVDDFRIWITWIRENQMVVLDGKQDFSSHCGFILLSDTESLKVETYGSVQPENPKEVYVLKLQILGYQPVFQEGFPVVTEGTKQVVKTLAKMNLDESGLSFSFRPVWKSPTIMAGIMTVNGEEIEGLVKRPGDGTGSYLDAVMYLGLMEMPPAKLSDDDLVWLYSGGRICWVYQFTGDDFTQKLISEYKNPPSDPNGWVKVMAVYNGGHGSVRYIEDDFCHKDYMKLVEATRVNTLALESKS